MQEKMFFGLFVVVLLFITGCSASNDKIEPPKKKAIGDIVTIDDSHGAGCFF